MVRLVGVALVLTWSACGSSSGADEAATPAAHSSSAHSRTSDDSTAADAPQRQASAGNHVEPGHSARFAGSQGGSATLAVEGGASEGVGAASVDGDSVVMKGQIPEARCPASSEQVSDFDALVDLSASLLESLDLDAAAACASSAIDLGPDSVEAHHVRASALAALGHFKAAQVAYAMALALDPDDPETLAAVANFYINLLPPKTRESTLVGLAHARRGSLRASARRRKVTALRARLALLEAQALNDLGRASDALPRINEAVRLRADSVAARYERGIALFNLCRFEEAGAAFKAVLALSPDDPYALYHQGLILERDGLIAEAEVSFRRARAGAAAEFAEPLEISASEFEAEVSRAVRELPVDTAKLLKGVQIRTPALPARADLVAVEPPFSPTILGLFRGLPLGVPESPDPLGAAPERSILLYRSNLVRAVKSRAELNRQIRRTLLHEIGHVAGLDEDALRRRGLD